MSGPGIHPYAQPWPPGAAAATGSPAAAPPGPPISPVDEVRTIFVTGLPADVKERELHNLLRWFPGYEASQINFKGEQPMGFALFSTPQYAMAAKSALQDLVFDPETKVTLHTEMAKKNLFFKRGFGNDSNLLDTSKRLRTAGDYTHAGYAVPFSPTMPTVWGPPSYIAPPPPYPPYGGYPVQPMPLGAPNSVQAPTGYAPVQNLKDNPPCNTLFVGNLGIHVMEEEVRSLFIMQPGFKQMKILRQERNTVCFIEFEDVTSAMNVHQSLQGAIIPSSGRGGIRIQFSKNPFGRRKDSINESAPPAADGDGDTE